MQFASKWMAPVLLLGLAVPAGAQSFDKIKDLWEGKQWAQVIPLVTAYRNQPGGRTWQVDYMLGTSECHVAGQEKQGAAVLEYVLQNYHLPDSGRVATRDAIEYCQQLGTAVQQEPSFVFVPVTGQLASGSLVSGKGGFVISAASAMTTGKVTHSPVPVDELQKRVFAVADGSAALAAARARLPGSHAGVVQDGFVVVCDRNCEPNPQDVVDCLKGFRTPLQAEFDMAAPQQLVTVYTGEIPLDVVSMANTLHGIALPLGTVAYSVYEDLSIVGIASYSSCGSLAHELVHLSIRAKFGDSPPWLEEGLASEVAVGTPEAAALRFGPSWRDDTLRRQWQYRPTVARLLASDWSAYSANSYPQVAPVASLQAMAAVFVRYLDAKKKLQPIYFALRDQRFPAGATAPRPAAEIVQEQMGMNMAQMDADFLRWFGGEVPVSRGAGNDVPRAGNDVPRGPKEPKE